MPRRVSRRVFVQQLTALGFGSYLSVSLGACKRPTPMTPPPTSDGASVTASAGRHLTFSDEQFVTMSAVVERLLPRDEDPGALDLGVPEYVDRTLADPDLAHWKDLLTKLLPVLDRQSRKANGGRAFHELSAVEQDALLARWQKGASGEKHFFDILFSLTLEGAFGDPRHGGNRDGKGYLLVGFVPGPPMPKMMQH